MQFPLLQEKVYSKHITKLHLYSMYIDEELHKAGKEMNY